MVMKKRKNSILLKEAFTKLEDTEEERQLVMYLFSIVFLRDFFT
jgi:hypothetical protein